MDTNTTGAPRDNQQHTSPEIDRQMLGKVARTMYTQSLALNEKIRTLSILQAIDAITLESNRGLKQLGSDISSAITTSSKFSLVSIFSIEQKTSDNVSFQGWSLNNRLKDSIGAQEASKLIIDASIPLSEPWMSSKTKHQIIPLDENFNLLGTSLSQQQSAQLYTVLKGEFGLNSLYVTKLRVSGVINGLLIIGLEEPAPHIDDIELIERIGNTTGIAIYNRILYEENLRSLEQLRSSNEKLKAIDTAKDEFIALASHQLRTPLTSMKGYVSMVLEGDYGPLSDAQRDALQKSYSSAQRMVYLVADLLNVSRLRTGKFVILNTPTDLEKLVEEEYDQMQQTAKTKNLSMNLKMTGSIPKLLIDGTKIRQVVMNFIDNAVYYTPNGGRVQVELTESEDYITFTVTDSGVGVPADEQANLFKKFYRATNAKKSRPDGTGLGLFMAAKVINAQGGQLLFVSKEGVGSTFGFRLPKTLVS